MTIKKTLFLPLLTLAVAVGAAAQSKGPGPVPIPQIDPRLLPRPPETIRAIYKFAADRPEVLRYVPCFCGCDQSGHRSSEDCFVKSRAKNGGVSAWNEHGVACAMCLAVAERAKEMCDKGASVKDVRADIERRYGNITGMRTPTPLPPK